MKNLRRVVCVLLLTITIGLTGCSSMVADLKSVVSTGVAGQLNHAEQSVINLDEVPDYSGDPAIAINGNVPFFTDDEMTLEEFENYSELDTLGRCGVAYANICRNLMPTEKRQEIGMVKPSGWHTVKYPKLIIDRYLYNRCHLIGFQLAGENANEKNLITGTRYFNTEGMLPYEDEVAQYVKRTNNHVLYRVTPIYTGDDLVAHGVLMEAKSVEDHGEGVSFNVYCYNVQPGISIDYASGDSWVSKDQKTTNSSEESADSGYVINTNTRKFHLPSCNSVTSMSANNRQDTDESRDQLIAEGYEPCGSCHP